MDIRCERCATEYELDEAKIPDAGVSIKCATCQHVFKVFKPAASAAAEPQVTIRLFRGGAAQDLPCPDEPTLRTWIRENRVIRTDTISFDGATWTPLGEVPELADAFPKAPEPKMAPAPVSAKPEKAEKTPQLHPGAVAPTLNLPLDATMPDMPRFQMPPLTMPVPDAGRTEPAKVDPAKVGLKAATPNDSVASLGKLNRPVEGAPPAVSSAPVFPSLSLPGDTGATLPPPPKAPPTNTPPVKAPAKAAAPATKAPLPPTAPPPARPSSRPIDKMETQPPRTRPAPGAKPPPPERKSGEGTDYEIAQFKRQGKPMRVVGILVGAAVVVGGGVTGYIWYSHNHVPEEAKAPYEEGRQLYLGDSRSHFQEAEADFQKAVDTAAPAPFADALGGMAELEIAWGEQLWKQAQPLVQQANDAKKAMDKAPQDASLKTAYNAASKSANELGAQADEHLQKGFDFANKALDASEHANLAAHRALLDYCRLKEQTDNGQKEEKVLLTDLKATDPETKAHIAAFDALDAKQLKVSEQALIDVTKSRPDFVRAWGWLADVHRKEGNLAAVRNDLQSQLSAAPNHQHEGATEALKALASPSAVAPAAQPAVATTQPAAQPAAAHEARETHEAPAAQPAAQPAMAAGPVDVDKLLKQGDREFEHRKYQKALEAYEKAVEAKPGNVDANFSRGLALSALKRFDTSIEAFQKTLQLSPKHGDAMIALAEAYKAKGAKQNAVKYYQMYIDTNPRGENAAAARANIAALH